MKSNWRRQPNSLEKPDEEKHVVTHSKKLLSDKAFLLDIENRQLRVKVVEGLQNAGATIMDSFDDRVPHCFISDHPIAMKIEKAKKGDPIFNIEKLRKTTPALLREALNREVKVRTPQTFLNQMSAFLSRRSKATSATTSNSTIRGRCSLGRENGAKSERTAEKISIKQPYDGSGQSSIQSKKNSPYLRVEVPGKRPEIHFVNRESYGTLYCGADTGFSIFKVADAALFERRQREYDQFLNGKYEPGKKNYKLNERDNYCQFCEKSITGARKDHERTDEHRYKAKTQGFTPALERIFLNARLQSNREDQHTKKKRMTARENVAVLGTSKRAGVEYEYGENEMKANWINLKENIVVVRTPEKSIISPRRRQKRMRLSSNQEDNPDI